MDLAQRLVERYNEAIAELQSDGAEAAFPLLEALAGECREGKLLTLEMAVVTMLVQVYHVKERKEEAVAYARRGIEIAEALHQPEAVQRFEGLLEVVGGEG